MVRIASSLLALCGATAVMAAPATQPSESYDTEYQWSVTGWSGGCARGGCYYYFDITGPAKDSIPEFSAHCSGHEDDKDYKSCEGSEGVQVSAKFLERPTPDDRRGPEKFSVQIQFPGEEESSYYTITGEHATIYNQFVAPEADFIIVPKSATGVA